MNHLTDDLINKYIDDETSVAESAYIKGHIQICNVCAGKLNAMKKVHTNLLSMKEESPSVNFTLLLMEKLERSVKRKKQQKYFAAAVFGLFSLLILAVLGYLVSVSQFSFSFSIDTGKYITEYTSRYSSAIADMEKYFSGRNLTLFGSILSMGIIISAYFFYNSHKAFKNVFK